MKKVRRILAIAGLFVFLLAGCGESAQNADAEFEAFTRELFCSEVSSNTLTLHYSLQDPQNYQVETKEISLGMFETDEKSSKAGIENLSAALEQFSYKQLKLEKRLTYDVIKSFLKKAERGSDYLLYTEPMNVVSGVQTQLPVLLAEYGFRGRQDVETYLKLLEKVPEYLESLAAFEQKKADAGLFMSAEQAQTVAEQCNAFGKEKENHYLITSFVERVKEVSELSEEEKSRYMQENAACLENAVFPAYEKLAETIERLKDSGKNEKGLCFLPKGKEYYEYVVEKETGSERGVQNLEKMAKAQILEDLQGMQKAVGTDTLQESSAQTGEREEERMVSRSLLILGNLEEKIRGKFPKLPETQTQVKLVPEAMQQHLSPAFYMIPEIDHLSENVIYLNPGYMQDNLSLYTTLAHEGFPGHLYQTVYYASKEPDPVRSVFDFGGYTEGWATYAEMCSYYLTGLEKADAAFLQKNASVMLGLYALADMRVHYDGWSEEDTLEFFSAYGIDQPETVSRIWQLIIGDPGNYLKYYIGYLEFLELKKNYMAENPDTFSQKSFHKSVLDVGPAPFAVVEKYMKE